MKASTFNLHSISKKAKNITSNSQIIVLVLLFTGGLLFGAFSVKNENSLLFEKLIPLYIRYAESKAAMSDITVFFSSMLLYSAVIILAYFTGLCAVGVPFVALIPVTTGVFTGAVSGYIYGTYMLRGLAYCGIIIFPSAVITVSAIIFASRESMIMSRNMLNLLSQRHNQKYEDFRSYSIRFLIYLAVTAAGAVVEALMCHLFIGLFSF